MACNNFMSKPLTRREMLGRCAGGFGAVALSSLLADPVYGKAKSPFAPRNTHHEPKAKSIIFLYMDGGVSQVDSFDYKPRLEKDHGKPFSAKINPTQFDNIGKTLKSPWNFKRYGQCGLNVSDLFPYVGEMADDLCVVRSMTSKFSEHNSANFFLHTGFGVQGRPSMGAWMSYGLGAEATDLPGFVVLNGGLIPSGGWDNFGNGFLPASHQATVFKTGKEPLADIRPRESRKGVQKAKLGLLNKLDQGVLERLGRVDEIESAIANYEMAYRMQAAVPELINIKGETDGTQKLYGLDSKYEPTRTFGMQCLIARRLVEKGVRFIELTCPRISGNDRWDAHGGLKKNHGDNSRAIDQPIAGLLRDLKSRGMLKDTLVVWSGEFGRTPFAQGSNGRDHNPFGFTIWMAGGGVKEGFAYGATDEFGYRAVENKLDIHDLHATMLHLLGMDHKKMTYLFDGRDMRLTDVHGHVAHDLIA
ncbi:MAG: sulfatase [Verrucomicrobiales bacterium]|nr:sulfatase [Verrucomicrobiales bacterium]